MLGLAAVGALVGGLGAAGLGVGRFPAVAGVSIRSGEIVRAPDPGAPSPAEAGESGAAGGSLPDLEERARALVAVPGAARVTEIAPWKPVVVGIVPPGWRVAADPRSELEYAAPGVRIRGPIYRLVPAASSLYFVDPAESGGNVPDQLEATARRLAATAGICEQVARRLRALAEARAPLPGGDRAAGGAPTSVELASDRRGAQEAAGVAE